MYVYVCVGGGAKQERFMVVIYAKNNSVVRLRTLAMMHMRQDEFCCSLSHRLFSVVVFKKREDSQKKIRNKKRTL
jgi:hypothetical protein